MSHVRVRFAPSPTGSTHIGTARTALFNWLFARKNGGSFVLRIEDTDRERNTQAALNELIDGLRWLGLDWDEGPSADGPHAPYFQSQRGDLYREYAHRLREADRAYEQDGATYFRLEGERSREYDNYLGKEVEKVQTEPVVIDDLIRGKVTRREERDFVIVRSNGDPSFHFVNVVDDIAMQITHVIRGEDHLSNTSKHIELFRAFGVTPPVYAHLPMILKDPRDGKGKMSKRDRGALIEDYRQRHFLPQAVVNFLALLGWAPKDGQELLTLPELIERFELKDVQKAGARFDEKKMSHLNFEYMKRLSLFFNDAAATAPLRRAGLIDESCDPGYLRRSLALCQEKIDSFENLPDFAAFFFTEDHEVNPKAESKIMGKRESADRIRELITKFKAIESWDAPSIEKAFHALAEEKSLKPFAWYPVARFAVSGSSGGPDLIPMLETLGRERVLPRLEKRLERHA